MLYLVPNSVWYYGRIHFSFRIYNWSIVDYFNMYHWNKLNINTDIGLYLKNIYIYISKPTFIFVYLFLLYQLWYQPSSVKVSIIMLINNVSVICMISWILFNITNESSTKMMFWTYITEIGWTILPTVFYS